MLASLVTQILNADREEHYIDLRKRRELCKRCMLRTRARGLVDNMLRAYCTECQCEVNKINKEKIKNDKQQKRLKKPIL